MPDTNYIPVLHTPAHALVFPSADGDSLNFIIPDLTAGLRGRYTVLVVNRHTAYGHIIGRELSLQDAKRLAQGKPITVGRGGDGKSVKRRG